MERKANERYSIPIRNVWLLLLYASRLEKRYLHSGKVDVEASPENLLVLLGELLAFLVEKRLRRNLSTGYRREEKNLPRVRGHILFLQTERRQLLASGKVACRYESLTIDTPFNRFVNAALGKLISMLGNDTRTAELRHRLLSLRRFLVGLGVGLRKPLDADLLQEPRRFLDRDETALRIVAKLVFDRTLPLSQLGSESLFEVLERDWFRKLFEDAVAGFYAVTLPRSEWRVRAGEWIDWNITGERPKILPKMQTDILLENRRTGVKIIVDTKFTSILKKGRFDTETLKSGYIYQIYAYLRSQEHRESFRYAEGVMLHPAIDREWDETVVIDQHPIRFLTVDLNASPQKLREQLLKVAGGIS
ncbi:MAG: 5-methylcytosine-specific restriction endonuclease system specificity protein McrC [Planctomycetia bacterium]|nr:5-methylcytosine-specific restriction endonuclease system specificity protein McrC [Planctomycetia bacterium]